MVQFDQVIVWLGYVNLDYTLLDQIFRSRLFLGHAMLD